MAKKSEPKNKQVHAPGEPVYTVMAFITFVALAVGCVLLYLDFEEYGSKTAPAEKVPTLVKLGDASSTAAAPSAP